MRGSIVANGVSKRFRRYRADRADTFQEAVLRGFRTAPPEYFWGLREVSFSISPGRSLGVIGQNGAGKSSLLRLIGGVVNPDEGTLEVHGRIGALLDLGAGLTDDLTGRENIMLAGLIAGMTRAEVRQRFESIVAFAELEQFIDSPLRTYSSGMRMRLAFSVAIHIDPDIILIDEVLAVGDAAFQHKCLTRIAEIKSSGCTIFFVSHDQGLVQALCDEVLFLKEGRVVAFGPAPEVMASYVTSTNELTRMLPDEDAPDVQLASGKVLRMGFNRFGSLAAEIVAVRTLNPQNRAVSSIVPGAPLAIELDYRLNSRVGRPKAGVSINRPDGTICFNMHTDLFGAEGDLEHRSGTLRLDLERLDLVAGEYFVNVGLYEENWMRSFDFHEQVYQLTVVGPGLSKGILHPPASWTRTPRNFGTEQVTPRSASG